MRTLAFDGRTGASGDMILGALLAAGADRDALAPVEDTLDVEYVVGETTRNGIAATTVDVVLVDDGDRDHHQHDGEHSQDDDHSHDGDHSHDDDHDDHRADHSHDHAEGAGPLRTYPEVVAVVESMDLPASVEREATRIFELLAEAEASVHGTDRSETHFHEVGADDAIADVVGAALLLDDLGALASDDSADAERSDGVERVVTTPLSAGGGAVEMSHGTYPVPAPAVVELAERADWSLRGGPVETELLTPTGAAILARVATGVDRLPALSVTASGYGAGAKSFPDHPNVLRALVGESRAASDAPSRAGDDASRGPLVHDDVAVLETNLDDAPPEVLGDLQASLAEVGARDVSILPTTMKKSRPGHLVKVIAKPEDAERVARRLAEETGTLGVREAGASHRWIAHREFETVALDVDGERFEVDVKVASDDEGTVYDASAEYDDAAAVARATDLPLREVARRAEAAWRDRSSKD